MLKYNFIYVLNFELGFFASDTGTARLNRFIPQNQTFQYKQLWINYTNYILYLYVKHSTIHFLKLYSRQWESSFTQKNSLLCKKQKIVQNDAKTR